MKIWNYIVSLLLLTLAGVIIATLQLPDDNLHIIACDVGQGDAILVINKNIQILTDGGPDKSVLDCLSRHIPFWDRNIEMVISTHSDADHLTGVVEVMKRYEVEKFLVVPMDPGTPLYEVLKNTVGSVGVEVVYPHEVKNMGVGLMQLDILYPFTEVMDVLGVSDGPDLISKYKPSKDANKFSIVYKLSFGEFSGLFTGDMTPEASDLLAEGFDLGEEHRVKYIKVPHHGSKNGLTENLLKAFMPGVAVISVGKNSYGHPHKEITGLLKKYGVRAFRTDEVGDIEIVTDGKKMWKVK